jgi:small-conductance mechanosensitive channel
VLLYVTALNAVLVSEARHNLAVMPLVAVAGAAGVTLGLRDWSARSGRQPLT